MLNYQRLRLLKTWLNQSPTVTQAHFLMILHCLHRFHHHPQVLHHLPHLQPHLQAILWAGIWLRWDENQPQAFKRFFFIPHRLLQIPITTFAFDPVGADEWSCLPYAFNALVENAKIKLMPHECSCRASKLDLKYQIRIRDANLRWIIPRHKSSDSDLSLDQSSIPILRLPMLEHSILQIPIDFITIINPFMMLCQEARMFNNEIQYWVKRWLVESGIWWCIPIASQRCAQTNETMKCL